MIDLSTHRLKLDLDLAPALRVIASVAWVIGTLLIGMGLGSRIFSSPPIIMSAPLPSQVQRVHVVLTADEAAHGQPMPGDCTYERFYNLGPSDFLLTLWCDVPVVEEIQP